MKKYCVYCQKNIADTLDHIPSRGLFPDTKDVKFLTVPACRKCNRGFSADEEYFRNFTANVSILSSPSADLLLATKIKRSIDRRPGLGLKLFQRMSLVNLITEEGIYLGPKTKVDIVQEDKERIATVIQKYIKALFFHHFEKPLPYENKITLVWLTPEMKTQLTKIIGRIRLVNSYKDVFAYGYEKVPENENSFWVLQFFNNLAFGVFVTTPELELAKKY